MANSSISHQGLSDAVSLFNKLLAAKPDATASCAGEIATPFNELLAARQISLLEPGTPGFQNLQGNALAALGNGRGGNEKGGELLADIESGELLPLDQLQEIDELIQAELAAQGFAVNNALAQIKLGKSADNSGMAPSPEGFTLSGKLLNSQSGDSHQALLSQVLNAEEGLDTPSALNLDKHSAASLTSVQTGKSSQDFGAAMAALLDARIGDEKSLAAAANQLDSALDVSQFSDLKSLSAVNGGGQSKAAPQFVIAENALTDPAWETVMTARIGWMSSNGVHTATLKLNPQELGGIHIQLNLEGDKANVQFQTEHRDTSEIIERLLPRLQSAFESQGIRLDETRVSHNSQFNQSGSQFAQQQQSGQAGQGGQNGNSGVAGGGPDAVDTPPNTETTSLVMRPGLDYYA